MGSTVKKFDYPALVCEGLSYLVFEVKVSSMYRGALYYYVLLNSNTFGWPVKVVDWTVGQGISKKFLSVKGNAILVSPDPFSMILELAPVSSLGRTFDPIAFAVIIVF